MTMAFNNPFRSQNFLLTYVSQTCVLRTGYPMEDLLYLSGGFKKAEFPLREVENG